MTDHTLDPCDGREAEIYQYLDKAMSPVEQAEFLAHLETCQTCQSHLAEVEALFADLASIPPIDLPSETVTRATEDIMAKLPITQVDQPSRVDLVILLLQMVVGLGLLWLVLPQFRLQLQPVMLGLSDFTLQPLTINVINNGVSMLGHTLSSIWMVWSQSLKVAAFDISSEWALALMVGLALAWLFGNALLLGRRPHLIKNGGVS